MGTLSIWHWILILLFSALVGSPASRIIGRTGHSRLWVLIFFIPIINVVALWVLAFVHWPALRHPEDIN